MKSPHGAIIHDSIDRKTDYLYRLSLKALIMNEAGEVLVVKESGRDWWDLPGGGMDHDENIKSALARELAEEVNLTGGFSYNVIDVDEPVYLPNANVWQVRMIFQVTPVNMEFSRGVDADEVALMNAHELKESGKEVERRIYRYVTAAASL